ncbi:MAG: endonuclease MutS2 [Ignavibacteriales bacterium]|nr:endonuclease MutS2 [Ignavibacteriales bacterium]
MNPDFSTSLRKLEFDKVQRRISELASSDPGKTLCRSIAPSVDPAWISAELHRVEEAKQLLITEGSVPLDGLKDILPHLKKTAVEDQVLTPVELLDVAASLRISRTIHAFLRKRASTAPSLAAGASDLFFDRVVEFNIAGALDESGQVRDSASKELQMIRADMAQLREQLRKRLSAILKEVAQKEMVQDDIITTRDGRLVIPVKAEFKHKVAGFIHSTSASGATVFIEPAETLDLNNALRELQFREQREIERILKDLTSQVAGIRDGLQRTLDILAHLDLAVAKARYSIELIGSAPRTGLLPLLKLDTARHPILLQAHARDQVVPLTVELGGQVRTIIITGPNAGGKSVALKTIGLSVLLTQAGIHIPASPDSEIPVFEQVFVDMGDDQSIEQDLSTFSSHLVNLRTILRNSTVQSLILIDEIGAGTDPVEGDALAASLLRRFQECGAMTVATTHHSALKVFAHETPGMANASMEFDRQNLRPTYRFRYGIPGSSYALELAERMDLDRSILEQAKSMLGEQKTSLELLITALQERLTAAREAAHAAEEDRANLARIVDSYDRKLADVRTEIRTLRESARNEMRRMISEAQSTIERLVKAIRESSASRDSVKAAKEALQGMIKHIDQHAVEIEESPRFHVGQAVRLKGTDPVGELTAINGDVATVLWENGTLRVPLHDLEPAVPQAAETHNSFSLPAAPSELDLRGMTGDEAATRVEHFLDEAFVAGLHRVDIIHGKGTGALRKRISDMLKDYPHVKSFRLGEWNEGGSGVTVVEFTEG